jgi:DNA-damage-inducible protein D
MADDTGNTGNTGEPIGEGGISGGVFETIRHIDGEGGEYWSARELAPALTYTRWEQFPGVIAKAREACEGSGYPVNDHFREVPKMIPVGKGAHRRIEDWHLSRYACYLIVQNADPSKPVVALGQTYFAVQTERARLADMAQRDALAGLTEAQRRLLTREQLAHENTSLASTAQGAGVVSSRDFAAFQDHGYRGLYAGETARAIAARKGLKPGGSGRITDYMGGEELAINLLRVTQTEAKIRREEIADKNAANKAHHDVGAAVRRFIIEDLGGTPPEQLPTPAESIQQLQTRERRALESEKQRERQPSLFEGFEPEDASDTDGEG